MSDTCRGQPDRVKTIAQAALANAAVEYEKMVGETLFIWRDVTNARLTYLRFIEPAIAYRICFTANVNAYLGFVDTLNSQLPLVRYPCAGQDLSGPPQFTLVGPDPGPCPFSIDFEAVVATLHIDCRSFGFDFKAGLACSVTKDFISGETTLTAGVGGKLDLHGVGNVSGAGQFVVVWDGNNDLSFLGVEAVATAKLSGIPGLSGTLTEDTLNLDREAGAESEGPAVTVSGQDFTKDLVKISSDTKLGVTIGPKGVAPSLTGEISGKVLGGEIFKIESL